MTKRNRKITTKQLAFAKEYTTNGGNATKAHETAYGQQSCNMVEGCRNLIKPKVMDEITRIVEAKEHKEAVEQEITEAYLSTRLLNVADESLKVKDRTSELKALELLGKSRGMFKDVSEVTDTVKQREYEQAEIDELRALAKLRIKQQIA